jgi:hypothetical protein
MSKHYVVLEYTVGDDINPKFIPWADLLAGGVTVTNYKDITQESLKESGIDYGVGRVLSVTDGYTFKEAYEELGEQEKQGKIWYEAPVDDGEEEKNIIAYEPFENYQIGDLLGEIEYEADNYIKTMKEFLNIDFNS